MPAQEIIVRPDPRSVARTAAERFVTLGKAAVIARGSFSVALAGGRTPEEMYRHLANEEFAAHVEWARTHIFWGDERCVPPDDPESNFRLAHTRLLSNVLIPAASIHRIRGELAPSSAAEAYAAELRAFFGTPWPRFDLVLLGMGSDGHIASLFADSAALNETARPVVAVTAHYADRPACRVTLTAPAINAARHVMFQVTGEGKAATLQKVLEGARGSYPAQWIQPTDGTLTWIVDAAAASQLSTSTLGSG
jgi:6-phosphogluconolactonase